MEFNLSEVQHSWKTKGESLGRDLGETAAAADVVMAAARVGLLDARADLLAVAMAVESLAYESSSAAVTFALHSGILLAIGPDARFAPLVRGETVGAIALSTDDLPTEREGRLTGRALLVGPLTDRGLAVIGALGGRTLIACAVPLDTAGTTVQAMQTAALSGFVCGHVTFEGAPCTTLGATVPFMTRARILLAATGLGMGRRALREALHVSRSYRGRGAGGEQTVQGLLADAATELDAAAMLTWKAASGPEPSLAPASMAKLAATEATQRAVARATQVVGADSFRRGHVIERLAQDVRALELFAGRTEALREAVADGILPRAD